MGKSTAGKFVYNTLEQTALFTQNGLRALRDKGWINLWEFDFCWNVYGKKKLTHKQYCKLMDINHRVIMNHDVPDQYIFAKQPLASLPALKYGT